MQFIKIKLSAERKTNRHVLEKKAVNKTTRAF